MAESPPPTPPADKASPATNPEKNFYLGGTAAKTNFYFGLFGTLFGLLGAVLAVIFWLDSLAERNLQFKDDYPSGEVVKAGQSSSLPGLFNGVQIEGNISVTPVAIGNAGKLAVKRENFREPIVVTVSPKAKILEVTLRTVYPSSTGFAVDTSEISKGLIKLDWKSLETNEGAVIQIIFAGTSALEPKLKAEIDGPRANPSDSSSIKKQITIFDGAFGTAFKISAVILVASLLVRLYNFIVRVWESPGGIREHAREGLVDLISGLAMLGLLVGSQFMFRTLASSVPLQKQPPQSLRQEANGSAK